MLGVGPSPTLSQLLKEAKSEVAAQAVEGADAPCPLTYSRLFDEYHGEAGMAHSMVTVVLCMHYVPGVGHLEALELLSTECAGKVGQLFGFPGWCVTLSCAAPLDPQLTGRDG